MSTSEKALVKGTQIWCRSESLVRVKVVLFLISSIMFAIAIEAIRVALTAGISGVTPLAFGLMPTRSLAGIDIPIVILIALLGITWVGYRAARVLFEGMPLAVGVVEAHENEPALLSVAWDGLFKPQHDFLFDDIVEIDAIGRGTMGGGGHHVRIRVKSRRIAVTIARFDTAHESEQLVRKLIAERERALGEDRDIGGE